MTVAVTDTVGVATLDGEGREGQRDQGPLCHRCLLIIHVGRVEHRPSGR